MTELDVARKVHAVSTFPGQIPDKNADTNGAELFLAYITCTTPQCLSVF